MTWKILKATLFELYSASEPLRESGSFASLVGYLARGVGLSSPLMPDSELSPQQAEEMTRLIRLVQGGTPIQYAVGKTWFYAGEFFVGEGILIPRPDTEILVEQALSRLSPGSAFYDLCCGSGCVGISVLLECKSVRCIGVDISETALYYTEKNARHNGVEARMEVRKTDLLSPCPNGFEKASLVVANPPYLTAHDMAALPPLVKKEPREALDGGEDGLLFYRSILENYRCLADRFLFEIGCAQAADVMQIAKQNGFGRVEVYRDFGGRDRVIYCEKNQI